MIRVMLPLWAININEAVKKAVIIRAAGLLNILRVTGIMHAPTIEPKET